MYLTLRQTLKHLQGVAVILHGETGVAMASFFVDEVITDDNAVPDKTTEFDLDTPDSAYPVKYAQSVPAEIAHSFTGHDMFIGRHDLFIIGGGYYHAFASKAQRNAVYNWYLKQRGYPACV